MYFTQENEKNLVSPLTSVHYNYYIEEHSLDVTNNLPHSHYATLLINDVSLEVDENGTLLYFWGLCPIVYATKTEINIPNYVVNRVRCLDAMLEQSSICSINVEKWPVYLDSTKDIICIGNKNSKNVIKFNSDSYVGLNDGQLETVWIKFNFVN